MLQKNPMAFVTLTLFFRKKSCPKAIAIYDSKHSYTVCILHNTNDNDVNRKKTYNIAKITTTNLCDEEVEEKNRKDWEKETISMHIAEQLVLPAKWFIFHFFVRHNLCVVAL